MKERKQKNNKYENLSKPSKEIDFHNRGLLTEYEITNICIKFLAECLSENTKKALIITGKGLHSKDKIAKIKPIVEKILSTHPQVKIFSDSRIDRGEKGAIEVSFY
jgi:DNA-nicking Smr family endonuclease